jgi:hypothetical protein
MKLSNSRQAVADAITAITQFQAKGIVAHLERKSGTDADIRDAIDADLTQRGISIVVMAASGAVKSQGGSGASLNALIAVAIYENPTVSASDTGCGISSEDAVELTIAAVCGLDAGNGNVELAESAWLREPQENGEIINSVGFLVPITIRRR